MFMTLPSQKFFGIAGVVVLLCLGPALPGSARVVTVGVSNGANALAFFPAVTNIATGDQVIWVWNNTLNSHSTTDTNFWDSGLQPHPFSFTNTFNSAGTFPYLCKAHSTFGMTGSIIVTASNSPPGVTITNPVTGTVFATPANVTIQATASDTDGTVTNVQFLVGATILTNKTVAPFFAVTNNLAAGSYTFSAIASDNLGAKTTNAVTISVVTPVAVALTAPARRAPANFQFSYAANVGLRYIVQRSTNLSPAGWSTLVTNLAGGSSVNFTDLNATVNPGFYRVGRLPNP
jgi:plastocyanin